MSIDRLSNMLSSIKNACMAGKYSVEVPYSKNCEEVAKALEKVGFLTSVKKFKEKGVTYKKLNLEISYKDGSPRISDLKRVSRPGRRIYKKTEDIGSVANGFGIMIVSTSRGIMSGNEARKKKLGGEILCRVW